MYFKLTYSLRRTNIPSIASTVSLLFITSFASERATQPASFSALSMLDMCHVTQVRKHAHLTAISILKDPVNGFCPTLTQAPLQFSAHTARYITMIAVALQPLPSQDAWFLPQLLKKV